MNLRDFRNSRVTFNARLPEGRAVIQRAEVELEPNALLVHQYEIGGQIGIIIQRAQPGKGNEYVWLWSHPSDEVELTLAKAEEELFAFLFGEASDSDLRSYEKRFYS